jgi:hypothetical protein
MFIQIIMQGADLSKYGQEEQHEKDDHVECSFCDDRPEGFIKRDLFILCKNTATGNFT